MNYSLKSVALMNDAQLRFALSNMIRGRNREIGAALCGGIFFGASLAVTLIGCWPA